MSYQFGPDDPSSELVDIIRQVRRRWRMKLVLRGALGVVGRRSLVLVLSAWGWSLALHAGAIVAFRIVLGVALLGLVGYLLVRPLMRRATDEQVALYLEEHEPSLQAAIISAVEARPRRHAGLAAYSAALVGSSSSRRSTSARRSKAAAASSARRCGVTARRSPRSPSSRVALFVLGPALPAPRAVGAASSCRATSRRPRRTASRSRPATRPCRAARIRPSPRKLVRVRRRAGVADGAQDAGRGVRARAAPPRRRRQVRRACCSISPRRSSYFVEADGVRSEVFTLKVVELPYVQRLELEYHFPAYTGLEPQKVEDGGDIAVLKGTEVRVRVAADDDSARRADRAVRHGAPRARAGGRRRIARAADRSVQGRPGRLLSHRARRADGRAGAGLAAVHDRRPGRSAADGVDQQAGARHLGVADRGSVRRGAGGRRFRRARSGARVLGQRRARRRRSGCSTGRSGSRKSSAGHTFYLEELDVKAGDFVSYYARAADNDGVQGAEAGDERHVFRARPPAQQGVPARAVRRGRRWRRRRRAAEPGRGALRAAAPDHRRDVQRPARSQEDDGRQGARERRS